MSFENIHQFEKYMSKKNLTIFKDHLLQFCNEYSIENDCVFLLQEIIDTKISYFLGIFNKNNYLKDLIKKKEIDVSKICYLKKEFLEPDKYKHIIEKKEIEAFRKNNQATSDAYKCKKCGESKCQVTQKQTRSGDEPATTFVECMECGYLFKF